MSGSSLFSTHSLDLVAYAEELSQYHTKMDSPKSDLHPYLMPLPSSRFTLTSALRGRRGQKIESCTKQELTSEQKTIDFIDQDQISISSDLNLSITQHANDTLKEEMEFEAAVDDLEMEINRILRKNQERSRFLMSTPTKR